MTPVLASTSLTYLWDGWRKFEQNRHGWWNGEIVLRDFISCLKNFAVVFDPDGWRLLESLLRTRWKGTPNSTAGLSAWCVEFCWVSGGDVSAGCVRLHVYAEECGQSAGNLIWW